MLNLPKTEEKIIKFWAKNKIFEKLCKKNKNKKPWSFLDGPITANNPMGVHHAWGRAYKDIFQRQKAMQGYDQRYQNGFDCQGLWVEVEVEKELGFKSKKDIEEFGIDKFVEKCKQRVKKYSKIQTQQSIRLGQWMDWNDSYYTMSDENNYSIWGFLKKVWQDGNLYKGRDCVPWCYRCGTAISQHEILNEEYKEVVHKSIYFKLPILNKEFKGFSFLVWTTTPWTIPANVALAVNPELEYGLYEKDNEKLILFKDLASKILGEEFELKKSFKGKELVGIKYQGIFDNLDKVKKAEKENPETFHKVILEKDLVTENEGTGIVHIAPGAGEEDFKIGQKEKLSVIDVIDDAAVYLDDMADFSGRNAKKQPEIIIDYIENYQNGKFYFKTENYKHRYPTCWRCKTELVWRVVDEWYIAMDKKSSKSRNLRQELINSAKKIKWIPDFGLERELDWLNNMHDWLISKKRYWGLALPIFECSCGNFEVIGSKQELKKRAVAGWKEFENKSPHRPWIDKVKIKCSKCGNQVSRILDVGNPWLDAGIVPFSTLTDPKDKKVSYFNDKRYWKKWFPAEIVCESFPGQFKNWFYTIIAMSTVLEKKPPVKTIFGFSLVKDEKGEEMHKSKGNSIEFNEAASQMGADVMRWMYAKQNPAYDLKFSYKAGEEAKRKLLNLWNSFVFLKTYSSCSSINESTPKTKNLLDLWIISRLNTLIKEVNQNLEKYDIGKSVINIENFFIEDLSLWYIRRSRKRFQNPENLEEKKQAVEVLYHLILNILKLIAPVTPFLAEEIYQEIKVKNMPESIHLCNWPKENKKLINKKLEDKMAQVREIVAQALAKRAETKIKVRQPLSALQIKDIKLEKELLELIKQEVNVKEIIFGKNLELNTKITPELKQEGMIREIIRQIQGMRKEANLKPKDKVVVKCFGDTEINNLIENNKNVLQKEGRIKEIKIEEDEGKFDIEKKAKVEEKDFYISIKKI